MPDKKGMYIEGNKKTKPSIIWQKKHLLYWMDQTNLLKT